MVSDRKIGQLNTTYELAASGAYIFNNQASEFIFVGSGGTHNIDASPTPEDNIYDVYLPEVMSYSDYYPFLMKMPGRNDNSAGYRYQGQGQEEDNEFTEGMLAFEYRVHDPRIGRFLSVDPLSYQYPYFSPYTFSGNIVIHMLELEGLEPSSLISKGKVASHVNILLSIGFGLSSASISETRWVKFKDLESESYTQLERYSSSIALYDKGNDAMTYQKDVVYKNEKLSSNEKKDYSDWLNMIAHEQTHRSEIHEQGWASWVIDYKIDTDKWGYEHSDAEMRAYSNGMRDFSLMNKFLDSPLGQEFLDMSQNNNLSQTQKNNLATAISLEAFVIPDLEKQLKEVKEVYDAFTQQYAEACNGTPEQAFAKKNMESWAGAYSAAQSDLDSQKKMAAVARGQAENED